MKTSNGVPVRIQKVGEADRVCDHAPGVTTSDGKPVGKSLRPGASAAAIEPKVEIREVEPGVFEITVTCRCGERSVVRCESLVSDAGKKD